MVLVPVANVPRLISDQSLSPFSTKRPRKSPTPVTCMEESRGSLYVERKHAIACRTFVCGSSIATNMRVPAYGKSTQLKANKSDCNTTVRRIMVIQMTTIHYVRTKEVSRAAKRSQPDWATSLAAATPSKSGKSTQLKANKSDCNTTVRRIMVTQMKTIHSVRTEEGSRAAKRSQPDWATTKFMTNCGGKDVVGRVAGLARGFGSE